MLIKQRNERIVNGNVEVDCVDVSRSMVSILRRDLKMNSYQISEILEGRGVDIPRLMNGGNGTFKKIRELAAKAFEGGEGDAILLRDLVQEVKKEFSFETRKAHNYTRNAVFSKGSSYEKAKINGIVFVVKS